LLFVAFLHEPNPDPRYKFLAVVFVGCSTIFWVRAITSLRLTPKDRAIASPFDPAKSIFRNVLLPVGYSFPRRGVAGVAATAILWVARLLQGIATLLGVMGFACCFIGAQLVAAWILDVAMFQFNGLGMGGTVFMAAIAMAATFIAAGWIVSRLAVLAQMAAQRLAIAGYDEIRAIDRRPPILFLRSFRDAHVTIRRSTFLNRLFRCEPLKQLLDRILVMRFSHHGPITALGRDQDGFGAACESSDDATWQSLVLTRALEAWAIVIIVQTTDGVAWEISEMLKPPFIDKTLFIAAPEAFDRGLVEQNVVGTISGENDKQRVIGAFRWNGEWIHLRSDELSPDDYILSLRTFFRRHDLSWS
jgi:hypothetical protein